MKARHLSRLRSVRPFRQTILYPTLLAAALLSAAGSTSALADVKMPGIFGDHMVLQQGAKLPVWGTADPGEKVTVSFAGQKGETTAGADGKWRVDLAPVQVLAGNGGAGGQGQTFTVQGKNQIIFQDVVVGEVWIASGQSNMEFGIQSADKGAEEIAAADDPQLRMFFVPWTTSLEPKSDIAPDRNALNGKWQVCSPKVMQANWAWKGFSAVAYFFGKEIRKSQQRPVGLIATYKGGTPAEAWTSIPGLAKDPVLEEYVSAHQKLIDDSDKNQQLFVKQNAAYLEAKKKWDAEVQPSFNKAMAEWKTAAATAKAAGQPEPAMPRPAQPIPQAPKPADGGFGAPGNLYNGMVAPLVPYAIKGVIWYQGESNGNYLSQAMLYTPLFPRLIADWREQWGQGNFPFLYVELANFIGSKQAPTEGTWPWVRDAQFKALSLPATGMATAIDVGDPDNIHPIDKADVGARLALAARHIAYGENIVAFGPLYESSKVEGNKIRLTFKSRGGGLTVGAAPWSPKGIPATPAANAELTGFVIAGDDQTFVPAQARIEGDSVLVSAASVQKPVAVRYNWADNPVGNLYNREKLPASAFRTDTWEAASPTNSAVLALSNGSGWEGRFQKNMAAAKGKPCEIIFDGDSITDWFQTTGKEVWARHFASRGALDFAIAGDQTSNILWRLRHGQVEGLDPKLVVLLIGTNNTIRDSSGQIVAGIRAVVDEYKIRCPHAHIVVQAIFPRRTPVDFLRVKIDKINPQLAATNWGERVTYIDLSKIWLRPDRTIRTDLMPGLLHPSAEGYEAWATELEPIVSKYVPAAAAAK